MRSFHGFFMMVDGAVSTLFNDYDDNGKELSKYYRFMWFNMISATMSNVHTTYLRFISALWFPIRTINLEDVIVSSARASITRTWSSCPTRGRIGAVHFYLEERLTLHTIIIFGTLQIIFFLSFDSELRVNLWDSSSNSPDVALHSYLLLSSYILLWIREH